MKFLSAAVLTLAFTLAPFAGAGTAEAATDGFHAAYFSESSFLTLSPGQTGQFSVGFSNTGTEAWNKGFANRQASLHTASPLDNPIDSTLGWSSNWVAPNIYANQANDLVAPGQIGFFVYSIKVPLTASGSKSFFGRPVIDGVGPMEDYGYYQSVTIAGAVKITNVTPASPSINNKPTLNGTGAASNEAVAITDGAGGTTVGTGIADVSGAWTITLNTALSAGTHLLHATTLTKGQSASVTYAVEATTGPIVLSAYATSTSSVTVTFSGQMTCVSTTGRNDITNPANFYVNRATTGVQGATVSTATAATDCNSTVLQLGGSLTASIVYQVLVYFVSSTSDGKVIDSQHNTAEFSIGSPSLSAASTKQNGTAVLTFSKSMSILGGTTGGNSVLNQNNYLVDSVTATTATVACLVSGLNGCITVQLTFTGDTASVLGLAGSVHTIGVTNVIDAISGGQLITPNPSNRQMATGS